MDETLQNYKIIVDIFKGYLDTAVTVHTSYYAFTGALTAYYLAHREQRPYVKYALLVPLSLGVALAVASFTGMEQALTLKVKVDEVIKVLPMKAAPPVDILRQSLMILAILDMIICVCLLLLIFWPRPIFGAASGAGRDAGEVKPAETDNGNDVSDKPEREKEESREQRVTAESKRRYVFTLLFLGIFIASTTILLGGISGVFYSTSDTLNGIVVFMAVVSAIGTISATILAWKSDRRNARKQELEIEKLERELAAEREKPALPTPKEGRK